jgi:hypothetical protein
VHTLKHSSTTFLPWNTGLPDFSWYNMYMYQNGVKIYRMTTELPIGHKIYRMSVKQSKLPEKIPTFSFQGLPKYTSNTYVYVYTEKVPSGSPGGTSNFIK